jgi:hypothetical protein
VTGAAEPVPGSSVSVLTSVLGEFRLGLEASVVETIDPFEEAARGAAPPDGKDAPFDLAALWGLEGHAHSGPRRMVRLRRGLYPRALVLGTQVEVRTLPATSFRELPALVRAFGARAGVQRIFLLDSAIGYLLDVGRLADLRGSPRG